MFLYFSSVYHKDDKGLHILWFVINLASPIPAINLFNLLPTELVAHLRPVQSGLRLVSLVFQLFVPPQSSPPIVEPGLHIDEQSM